MTAPCECFRTRVEQDRARVEQDKEPPLVLNPKEDARIAALLDVSLPSLPMAFKVAVVMHRRLLAARFAAEERKQRPLLLRRHSSQIALRNESATMAAARASGGLALTADDRSSLDLVSSSEQSGESPVSALQRTKAWSRRRSTLAGPTLLTHRLAHMELTQEAIDGDGNCQFRAMSYQLYGTQRHHNFVRQRTCDEIIRSRADYEIFFEPETSDFINYVAKMRQTSTWGDELTLRAACDTFAVTMHVITSTKENWHLCYVPSAGKSRKCLFLTYVSPVHYNAIHLKG